MVDLVQISDALLDAVQQDDFAGYDPFDSLNSRLLKATPLYRSAWVRLAWLQFGKRSPINFRAVLGIPKKRNPKGVALFILGMLEDFHRTGDQRLLDDACNLGDWLLTQQCDRELWKRACWGYHFDWQARAFYVPVGKPNIITTTYVARALQALGEVKGAVRFIEAAEDAAYFMQEQLLCEHDGRKFFAYIPGELTFVHNASLWGAAWVGFVGARKGDEKLSQLALEVARQSAQEQRNDGAWVYGARHHHQFVDGFHTGYNLEALTLLAQAQKTNEFDGCIAKGLAYYRKTFLLPDGAVKYYDNDLFPLDMHSFAQAVFTLIRIGGEAGDMEKARKVLDCAISRMYIVERNQFIYQKTRCLTNRINYTRWTQAWAYYALAFFNRYAADGQSHRGTHLGLPDGFGNHSSP